MKHTVYLETTIISYLAARPARDPMVAGRQAVTHEWWNTKRSDFDLFISDLVLDEIQAGDSEAAKQRLKIAAGIPALAVSEDAVTLAEGIIDKGLIPERSSEDSLHVAVCAVNGIDLLLTWNCTHLANAILRFDLEPAIGRLGYVCPVICTPEELMEP